MNSLPTQAILCVGAAIVTGLVATFGSVPAAIGLACASIMAVLASVAFAAQAEHLRDRERLVYRPVYVRRHDVQRRVISDD